MAPSSQNSKKKIMVSEDMNPSPRQCFLIGHNWEKSLALAAGTLNVAEKKSKGFLKSLRN